MENLTDYFNKSVKHWYLLLILGLIFVACGIYAFSSPLGTYLALSLLFSVSFIVTGIGDLAFGIANAKRMKDWGWYLVIGIVSLIMGGYLIAHPGFSMTILPFVVGFTLMFRSFHLLGFSLDLKQNKIPNWGYATVMSILGIVFSLLLLANPIVTSLSIVVLTGLSFVFLGIAYVLLSFSLKKLKKYSKEMSAGLKEKIARLNEEVEKEMNA